MPTRAKRVRGRKPPPRPRTEAYHARRTAAWQRTREAWLSAEPLCQRCLELGRVTGARYVHHIRPLERGGPLHDWDNLSSVCAPCHQAVEGTPWRPSRSCLDDLP